MSKTESCPSEGWTPSNLEPMYRVLPADSPLRAGVAMLDRVVFALSNTELKSALLLCLEENPQPVNAVEEKMRTKFPRSWPEVPQPYKVLHFMRSFICTAGFAEEKPNRHFLTTADGEGIAKDSAAFFLKKAADLGVAFGPILKERSDGNIKNQTRAYILRLSILFALDEDKAVPHRELNEKIGQGNYNPILWNLSALARRRLVLYEPSKRSAYAKITPLGLRFLKEAIEPALAAYSGHSGSLQLMANTRMQVSENPDLAVRALDQYRGIRSPKPKKFSVVLSKASFWSKLTDDVKTVQSGTAIDSFLRRFDPSFESNMGPGLHHGSYYNLRQALVRFNKMEAGVALLSYKPPSSAPLDVVLAVRTAQKAIRENLEVKTAEDDDFSDMPALLRRKSEQVQRLADLKKFFEEYGFFNAQEEQELSGITTDQIQMRLAGLKGSDVDDVSFAAAGFGIRKDSGKFTYRGLPPQLRSAFLIYAFEQYRKGLSMPVFPIDHDGYYAFKNAEVKKVLQVMGFYLEHYQEQARKKNPDAVLSVFSLVSSFKNYIRRK